jgi:transcriptional regulator with XRE-family HTH domain
MTVGEKIRACREAKHLTQSELGLACGVAKQTIFKYETGVVTNIPLDKLQLIASALDVSAAYLMGWDASQNEERKKPSEYEGLSAAKISLIEYAKSVPDDKAELVLKVIRSIVEAD